MLKRAGLSRAKNIEFGHIVPEKIISKRSKLKNDRKISPKPSIYINDEQKLSISSWTFKTKQQFWRSGIIRVESRI